jgi:hypothetical protein
MNAVRVVDVAELGEEAVLVEGDQTLLLIDGALTCDRRMEILGRVMDELEETA